MRNRFLGSMLAVAAVLAFAPALSAQAAQAAQEAQAGPRAPGGRQQRAAAPAEVKPTPRLPDGKPDLAGVWIRRDNGDGFFSKRTEQMVQNRQEASVTTAEEAMRPEVRAKYAAQLRAGKVRTIERDLFDPSIKACAPLGPARMIQQGRPFEIIQIPNRVFIHSEWDHWPRDVWMDGREHPKEVVPTWMGHSIGRWDGDTLVVDTVGYNDITPLDSPGHPHSEALHTAERYTRVNSDTLQIQITFEDPEIYTKPLVGNTMTYRLVPNGKIIEWVTCDDRIRLVMETEDVCKISGAWEFEAYCARRAKGLPTNIPSEGSPQSVY